MARTLNPIFLMKNKISNLEHRFTEIILTLEIDGVHRPLISACFVCDFMRVHRRLIQTLVRQNRLKMYNGLLDFKQVLLKFPNFKKLSLMY